MGAAKAVTYGLWATFPQSRKRNQPGCAEKNVPPFPTLFFSVAGAILSSVKKNLSMLQDGTKAPLPVFFFGFFPATVGKCLHRDRVPERKAGSGNNSWGT